MSLLHQAILVRIRLSTHPDRGLIQLLLVLFVLASAASGLLDWLLSWIELIVVLGWFAVAYQVLTWFS